MSGWRSIERRATAAWSARRGLALLLGCGAAFTVAACGGGQRQDVAEPKANFAVEVPTATFPTVQRLSQHTNLVIAVRNVGNRTLPNVAVTICNVSCAYPAQGNEATSAQAFAENINVQGVADPSRPVWIVDRPPGLCGYSCKNGGPGGAATAYNNTWALGRLAPGATATFTWAVTAVKPGTHVVAWEVAAGLTGKAKALLASGTRPHGSFTVTIRQAPRQSYVTDSGQIKQIP